MALHLAVCELYHTQIHGASEDPPVDIAERFIVREILSLDDFFSQELDGILSMANKFYLDHGELLCKHPTISNYNAITASPEYVRVDVVKVENYTGRDGLEWCTGCLKTSYIRILQKAWRNARKRRNAYIQACKSLSALRCRETTGRFPFSLRRSTTLEPISRILWPQNFSVLTMQGLRCALLLGALKCEPVPSKSKNRKRICQTSKRC